jgi:hypothetical protein
MKQEASRGERILTKVYKQVLYGSETRRLPPHPKRKVQPQTRASAAVSKTHPLHLFLLSFFNSTHVMITLEVSIIF